MPSPLAELYIQYASKGANKTKDELKEIQGFGKGIGQVETKLSSLANGLRTIGVAASAAFAAGAAKGFGKGIQGFGKGVGQVEAKLSSLASGLRTIGVAASAAFAAGAASMIHFAATADPMGFAMFKAQVSILNIEIGRIFIPILHRLTDGLRAVNAWLNNLTPVQRRAARMFAIVGVAILGLVGFVGIFSAAMLGLIPVVATTVASINAILTAGTGGLWALALAAGAVITSIVALGAALLGAVAGLFVLGQQGETLGEKLSRAWEKIWSFIGPILEKIGEGWYRIWAIGKEVFSALSQIFQEFTSSLGDMSGAWYLVQGAVEVFVDEVIEGVKVVGAEIVGLVEITKQFAQAFMDSLKVPQNMIQALIADVRTLMTALSQIDWKHPVESAKRVQEALDEMAKHQAEIITQPMQNIDFGKVMEKMKNFQTKANEADKNAKKEFNNPKTTKDETPEGMARTPQLMDVAEVWKHAQQSQQNDPRLEVEIALSGIFLISGNRLE